MDGLLQALTNATSKVLNWVHTELPVEQQHLADSINLQPAQQTIDAVHNDFSNFANSAEGFLAANKQKAEDFMNNTAHSAHSLASNSLQDLWNSGALGFSLNNNPVQNFVAHTPQMINQGVQAVDSAMPHNFFGNVGQDVAGVVGGALSLPGQLAQVGTHPEQLPQMAGSLGQGLVQNYAHDFGFDNQGNWSLQNAGNNLYNRPVSTLLDLLPVAGLLGKAGSLGKAGEAGQVAGETGTTADTLSQFDQSASALPPQERLANLLNYQGDLSKMGYSRQQLDHITAPMAAYLKENEVQPNEWDTHPANPLANSAENSLFTDQHSQQTAEAMSELPQNGQSPIPGVDTIKNWASGLRNAPEDIQNNFADWVNGRSAAPIEGMAKAQDFTAHDGEGLQGILNFQKDANTYPEVKQYFDNKYNELKNAGIDMNYKADYLPQLWDNPDQAQQFFGRRLSTSQPFTLESVMKNYQEGIDAGLKPRYDKLSDLVSWYEGKANRLQTDHGFFDYLRQNSLIQPSSKAPQGWQQLGQGFPQRTVTLDDGSTYTGSYSAPSTLAGAVNQYLQHGEDSPLAGLANIQSRIKNTVLASGIPKTGLSWHGLSTLTRQTLASNNPVSGFLTGVKFLASPGSAQSFIDHNLQSAADGVHAGLKLSIEDHNFFGDQASSGLFGKLSDVQRNLFEDPLFKQAIPALKIQKWKEISNDLVKNGYDQQSAGRIAATQANDIFGGLNLEQIARNPQFQQLMRNTVFAPDFTESTLNIGKGMTSGLLNPANPEGKVYRTFARNLALSYIALNVTNKLTSGHYSFQNQPGHEMDLELGTTNDGQKRYMTPFASGADMVKLPMDFVSSLVGGNSTKTLSMVRNRLAPLAGQAVGQLSNTNYLGQPITKKDASGPQQWLDRGAEALAGITPPQIGAAARYMTGNQGAEQAIASGMQAPLRYAGGAYSNTDKNLVNILQSGGASGDEINQILSSQKAQAAPQQQPGIIDHIMNSLGLGQPKTSTTPGQTGDILLDELHKNTKLSEDTKTIKTIFESGMSPDQMNQALQAKGIDPTTAREQMIKSLPTASKAVVLQQVLSQSGTNWVSSINELAQKGLLTSAVVNEWYKNNSIDYTTKLQIDKKVAHAANGTPITQKSVSVNPSIASYPGTRSRLSRSYLPAMPTHQLQAEQYKLDPVPQLSQAHSFPLRKARVHAPQAITTSQQLAGQANAQLQSQFGGSQLPQDPLKAMQSNINSMTKGI